MGYGLLAPWLAGMNTIAAGALAGAASGAIMTGSLEGALTGALWGAIGAGVALGIGHGIGLEGAGNLFAKGVDAGKLFIKSALHGLSRGIISIAQGGTFKAGFASGFSASFFSPGTTMGGDGAGGFGLRTSIASIVGGTAFSIGGGKFSNGAISAAFVHMFNAEMTREEIDMHNKKVVANEQAFKNAYGKNGEAYMVGDTKVGLAAVKIGYSSLAVGVAFGFGIYELGYELVTAFSGGITATLMSAGFYTEMELGFGNTNYKNVIKNSLQD